MRVWRLTKTRYANDAFDGEGARIYGGRWNSRGTRVAYASSNSALAVLEVLIHLTGGGGTAVGYSLISGTLPDSLVEELKPGLLPKDWKGSPVPPSVQAIGDEWIATGRSLALSVPSVIVEDGFNILINPAHADFGRFTVDSISAYDFDPRLAR